ncbi:MAG: cell division topological specificity factor MinE [Firmicutes bacterium]|nr:cell division topological specificity factor MinE [Bacillota bacterium]
MLVTQRENIKNRLKSLVLSDRIEGLDTLLAVLNSDIKALLANYMILEQGNVKLVLEIADDGKYHFNITVITNRLIDPGKMIVGEG